ncbi:proline-rich protein HaeIII subfamily 1-like [Strigops habroptila]|uniref:proline-rich protein HaeIII subfamily 1-like n=1 Tax=Strigops habroptila TaxID=2489341 RepID=UPI0011D01193|nr:proline-rich protein HaeIII subfamily 1-like [Strigops habroptila]
MAEAKPGGGGGGGGRGDPGLPPPYGPRSGGGGEPPPAAPCRTARAPSLLPGLAPGVPAAPARPPRLTLVYLLRCLARPQAPSSPATGTPRRPSLPPPPAGPAEERGVRPGRRTATAALPPQAARPGPAANPRPAACPVPPAPPCPVQSQAPGRLCRRRETGYAPRRGVPYRRLSGDRTLRGLGQAAPASIVCMWLARTLSRGRPPLAARGYGVFFHPSTLRPSPAANNGPFPQGSQFSRAEAPRGW